MLGLIIFGVSRFLNYFFSIDGFGYANNIFFMVAIFVIIYPFSMGKGYRINSRFVKYNITKYELIIMVIFFSIILLYKSYIIMLIFLILTYISYRRMI